MKPRSSMLAAAALLLILGCSTSYEFPDIEAHRPGPSASPLVAAAGPRTVSNEVVFVPVLRSFPRPASAAAPRRGSFVAVGSGDDGDLPPVPVPDGWVPAPEPTSRQVLGLEGEVDEMDLEEPLPAAEPEPAEVPVFAEEAMFAEEPAFVDGPREEATWDEGTFDEESESIVVEEIRYVDSIECESGSGGVAAPVLVVQGWSSWGCGPYPVVRSSRRFDPCFTPPGGACWEPVDYDPCWDACTDPDWGSWNRVGEEKNRRGHVGTRVVGDDDARPRAREPKPRRDPVAREDPPAPAPAAPAPAARTPRVQRPDPVAVEVPAAPRPEPAPRAVREVRLGRVRAGIDVPAPRVTAGGNRVAPRDTVVAAVPTVDPDVPAAPVHRVRPAGEPRVDRRPEPRAEPRAEPRSEPRAEPRAEPRPDPKPEPRVEQVREPRRVEAPRPEPAREPSRNHGNGRDRAPEVQAPPTAPPPSPPPPPPARSHGGDGGGGGRRGK